MSDLKTSGGFDAYRSHPDKKLADHTAWVTRRLMERTGLTFARISSLFHDVGKVNPNFQFKVNPQFASKRCRGANSTEYSNHAYLSALTFFSFPDGKKKTVLGLQKNLEVFSVMALAARHHGSLRNFAKADHKSDNVSCEVHVDLKAILSEEEYERAREHIRRCTDMPLASFASHVLNTDVVFDVNPPPYCKLPLMLLAMKDSLPFFMQTQFAFGCLVESDKRDASNNNDERRRDGIRTLMAALGEGLSAPFALKPGRSNKKVAALNEVRTHIRAETLINLAIGFEEGRRVFSLASPTGSGKTLTLLAAANAILKRRNGSDPAVPAEIHGVIYNLPFLSITEQVETVCEKILPGELVLRADSSASHPTIERLMRQADTDPLAANKLLREDFAELIFDSPLVITTFVQFFETLMSHRNATLLKLPNFARSVILIDEVQALPPRLYVFFTAYLDAFCREFDSYVILSTATMPNFALSEQVELNAEEFFPGYQEPYPLVGVTHFQAECFQRYVVEPHWEIDSLTALADAVLKETEAGNSVMVILNTIENTRDLYKLLDALKQNHEVVLLNTRFIPLDRRTKIARCKNLNSKRPLILVTTQLVEAGVELDFPVVFRDLCPLPSLIQTAGRCNRHNKLPSIGRVLLVDIKSAKGRSQAESIYLQDMEAWYLNFTRDEIRRPIREDEFSDVQERFFKKVQDNLIMGKHPGLGKPDHGNLIFCIRDAAFEDAGKFQLIRQEGEIYAYYVSSGPSDDSFEVLEKLADEVVLVKKTGTFAEVRLTKLKLETHLRRMRERVVQARIKLEVARELGPEDPVMGIRRLASRNNYTEEFGLELPDDDYFW